MGLGLGWVGVDLGRCPEAGCSIGVGIRVLKEPSELKSESKSVGFSEISAQKWGEYSVGSI